MKKAVLITGASKGIGLETARLLVCKTVDYDCIVMVARPSPHFIKALADVRARSNMCEVMAIEADLSDPRGVDAIYAELEARGITVTTIINNAGFTKPASINEAKLDDFERTLRVNLLTPFRIVQAAVQRNHDLKQVINVASTAGMNGRGGWLTYSASKAAMINMSEVMREDLKPYGVEVVCLSPGRCATDLRKALAPDEDPSTIMQPGQVASIIQFMTTETGRLLNSQNMVVRT
ncbi:MAG: SDR family oxidoreductase [Paracoccaceae bacterium]